DQARVSAGSRACLVFGPGSGQSERALRCLLGLLPLEQPLVIDADGLNLLSTQPHDGSAWQALRARGAPTWLTPHPTEAGRLLGVGTATVLADRLGAARRLHDLSGARIVLKGAGSVLVGPHGKTWVNASGNGLLATAGSGDVLSGALAACLAASGGSDDAGRAAVWLHGAAADLALRESLPLRAGTLPELMLRAWREARRPA
ncbi:MAG: NAD(P)H-hydrate dehydratase, partial [Betaproteobacteria bacterium]|nr:NAD(P)H-hydrate dehydratase [Betaproteobacteria bacterium]